MQRVLVCLHGWGGSKESFIELRGAYQDANVIFLVPDLPGFGSQPEPETPWNNDNYADWVQKWIMTALAGLPEPINSIEILGHSHGGRIALKLAYRQSIGQKLPFTISHLYLVASAGIFHPRHIKRIVGLALAKCGKVCMKLPFFYLLEPLSKRLLYRLVRVHDYERASTTMKTTMQRVVREDFRPFISHVSIPVDIFWGTDDGMTPISDAYFLHKHLPVSNLHIFAGERHGIHKSKAFEIAEVIKHME